MRKVNSFGTFLESLQETAPSEAPRERSATATSAPPSGNANGLILTSLQYTPSVDPSELLGNGLDFVELGRAVERLRSLDAIQMLDSPSGRQLIHRGPKYDDVFALFTA